MKRILTNVLAVTLFARIAGNFIIPLIVSWLQTAIRREEYLDHRFGRLPGAKIIIQFDQLDTGSGQLLIVFLLSWNRYNNAFIEYRSTLS
jgi:hypothetical protein